ncbi:recombination protein NinG [Candidatus Dojkabacteria bacterium]|jgi:hypothetical protein|nr:recombination protein NinG [Candidatus Dojkabacteria bacterium]
MTKSDLTRAKDKAWKEFSRYIRVKYANDCGCAKCVTCNSLMHWKDLQAGHFIDGRGGAVLFNEKIVFPQCCKCNVFLKGNKVSYTLFMLKSHTQEEIAEFEGLKFLTKKRTVKDYKKIERTYRTKFFQRLKELGINEF